MRSTWLSREYEKSKNIEVIKEKKSYLLVNKKYNTKLLLTNEEYSKYETKYLSLKFLIKCCCNYGSWRILIKEEK